MNNPQKSNNSAAKFRFTSTSKDLLIIALVSIFIFVLSYFFDVFKFLVDLFQKHPNSITWIDEIITGLLTLSIGFAIFSWRRWRELRKETVERIRLQEQIIQDCEIKAETERIICKQLHCDIEEYKKIERDVLAHQLKTEEQLKKKL